MRQFLYELKLIGANAIWIFTSVVILFTVAAYLGGDLLHIGTIGYEVIFPFLAAVSVGEWGKTRADVGFDLIASQSKSLFSWVLKRFVSMFLTASFFGLVSMLIVFFVRYEMPLWEMVVVYFPPAFFLSSLCALCGICFSGEHIATLICGVIWIFTMLARNLMHIPGVEYIYLFIRYTGDINGIWLINKGIITLSGAAIWIVIYILCKKRISFG